MDQAILKRIAELRARGARLDDYHYVTEARKLYAQATELEHARVIPVYSSSPGYTEWDILLQGQAYCVVCEGQSWTLLVKHPSGRWEDSGQSVETFLEKHHLALAEG